MDFINQNIVLICLIGFIAIMLSTYLVFKSQIDFKFLKIWYSIWKLGDLAKDRSPHSIKPWTRSERHLCDDFKRYINPTSKPNFEERRTYLAKAQDIGRTPPPLWFFLLLIVLVVAEGLGFSYLLGTWMAMDGSSDTRNLLMWAIVFVLCTILIFIMHSAGHQLYRSNLIRRCDREWRESGQSGKLSTQVVRLDDPQSIDDNVPEYTQCINRVGKPNTLITDYFMLIVAVLFIVLIAVASTRMRIQHMESDLTQQTTQSASTDNPYASKLPDEVTKPQQTVDKKARTDQQRATEGEGIWAFLMLAFIFIVTQIVGITSGFKWGFAGKESNEALIGTKGFSKYDDYLAFYEPLVQDAQSYLQDLQQRLNRSGGNEQVGSGLDYTNYLAEKNSFRTFGTSQEPVTALYTEIKPNNIEQPIQTDLASALVRLDSLKDKESKKDYLLTLNEDLRSQVIATLSAKKTKIDERKVLDEHDHLFM